MSLHDSQCVSYLLAKIWPEKIVITIHCSLVAVSSYIVEFKYTYILFSVLKLWSLVLSSCIMNWTLGALCSVLEVGTPVFNIVPNVLAIVCSPTQIRFHVFQSVISGSADLAAFSC